MAENNNLAMPNNNMNKPIVREDKNVDSHDPIVKTAPPQDKEKGPIIKAVEDSFKTTLDKFVIPTVLDGLYNIFTGFLGLLLKQDSRPISYRRDYDRESLRGTHVAYGDIYDSRRKSRESVRRERDAEASLGRADLQVMSYWSVDDAYDVYFRIKDYLDVRDKVSVARVYEWSNRAAEMPSTAKKWGWYRRDFKDIRVEEDKNTGKGYIYFPRVLELPDD